MAKKAEYGRGHPKFLAYVQYIVKHPMYADMPDVYLDDGNIQWEAPSNRKSGKFVDTHLKRRAWWRKRAIENGINPDADDEWISRTAKKIHPTKTKPCKKCGRVLDTRYVYPSAILLGRIRNLTYLEEDFSLEKLENISDLLKRLVRQYGKQVFADLPALLQTSATNIPAIPPKLDGWLKWINDVYIASEPSTLSPGAMSNAPDRLDGFHSFNRCCRDKADRGRSKENLQSYATDRRVFEYWIDGDWVAADHLMGIIRSDSSLQKEPCLNGHPGPCSADHVGPISLGFSHRPEFQFVCKKCNSAKNNRMFLSDVQHLRKIEAKGEKVISWHTQKLWDLRKGDVVDKETALRLSKLLRDNRHTLMHFLQRIAERGHFVFLASLLDLGYADYDISIQSIHVENHITKYSRILRKKRETKYALEQKARRLRVAFESLDSYFKKQNRNAFVVTSDAIEEKFQELLMWLDSSSVDSRKLDKRIQKLRKSASLSDTQIRSIISQLPDSHYANRRLRLAKAKFEEVMNLVAHELSQLWSLPRYVRN